MFFQNDLMGNCLAAYMSFERRTKREIRFPKVKPHAPNTVQTPAREQLNFWERVKQSIWAIGTRLRENDMKYAIKAGMATAILAAPAFFETTRPIFTEYRGEWALISVWELSIIMVNNILSCFYSFLL
jgi:hypothetical protein